MASIQILLGTVNGNALQCAQAMTAILQRLDHQVVINDQPSLPDLRNPEEYILVCCSTTGDGELPRQLYPVYLAIEDGAVDLAGRCYGVVALGDSGYPQYAAAGMAMEAVLYNCGAQRLGEILFLDAQTESNPALTAAKWAVQWQQGLGA